MPPPPLTSDSPLIRVQENWGRLTHFFRRTFVLLRTHGAFGLIATNTIAQGDTRASGLRWICTHGGSIFSVRRRVKWPGLAAVVVSVLHIAKGSLASAIEIDGREVECVTAFLFHRGGHEDPSHLLANESKSYTGAKIYGQGFLFDDTDTKGVASPLSEMHRLIEKNPRSQDVIFPYIGGQEVNTSPTHAHHRYVINFREYPLHRRAIDVHEADTMSARNGQNKWEASWADTPDKQRRAWLQRGRVPLDYPEPVAADWPDLLAIAEERVKPERMKLRETPDGLRLKATWWQFGRLRPELHSAITGLERVLVNSQVS